MTCCCLLLPAANLIDCHVGGFHQKSSPNPLAAHVGIQLPKN